MYQKTKQNKKPKQQQQQNPPAWEKQKLLWGHGRRCKVELSQPSGFKKTQFWSCETEHRPKLCDLLGAEWNLVPEVSWAKCTRLWAWGGTDRHKPSMDHAVMQQLPFLPLCSTLAQGSELPSEMDVAARECLLRAKAKLYSLQASPRGCWRTWLGLGSPCNDGHTLGLELSLFREYHPFLSLSPMFS